MQLSGLTVDSDAASRVSVEDSRRRTSTTSTSATRPRPACLNTAGYRFNQTDLNNRDQYGFRVDYALLGQPPVRGRLQLLQGDRRSHRPRFRQPRSAARLHQLRSEAVLAGVALARQLELPERAAWRRQPRAGAVRDATGTISGNLYTTALSITNPVGGRFAHGTASRRRAATPTPIRSTTTRR